MDKDKVSSQPTRRVGKKTILFFPIEVGLAHIVRSFAIAKELVNRGHRVIFALPKRKHALVKNSSVDVVDIAGYTDTDGIDFISEFKHQSFLIPHIKEELRVLKQYTPDSVVVDFRPTAIVSTALMNVPTIFFAGGGGMPGGCYIPNFGLPKPIHQLISPFIQRLIARGKGKYIDTIIACSNYFNHSFSTQQIISRMHYIAPEFPSYLPVVDTSLDIHYVGPIAWEQSIPAPSWLSTIKRNGKTIYLTFGGTGFDSDKLVHTATQLVEKGYRVLVSSSSIAKISSFPKHPQLFVEKFLPGKEVCKRVDLMVCHGGYGTMIDAVRNSIPIVATPFNPDQVLHSLRFAEYGVARCIIGSKHVMVSGVLQFNWKKLQNLGHGVTVDQIVATAEHILHHTANYTQAIAAFQQLLPAQNGSITAATAIEQLLEDKVSS
jgi:UDP:flavonoid glycosyltransferase YjiC (YdhE family)